MDPGKVPDEAVQRYDHRDPADFQNLKEAETHINELFEQLEDHSDQSIESEPVDSEHPYFSMLGRLSVPGEMDVRVVYPEQVSTGDEPWEWRKKSSSMDIETVYPEEETGRTLDEAVEERVPHEDVIDIHGENISNGGELIGAGVSRLTEPQRTYQIISYTDVDFPQDQALEHVEDDNPATAKIARHEINQKALALTTVIIEQQNALVETDYITPTYDMMSENSEIF
jgi:hypothetical protein